MFSSYHLLMTLFLLVTIEETHQYRSGRCVLNDGCDVEKGNCSKANIIKPKPLTQNGAEKLKKICPSLFPSNSSEINRVPVCCSAFGVMRLKIFLKIIREEFVCAACWLNFKELFCQLLCSPNQADFVKVDKKNFQSFRGGKREIFQPTVEYFLTDKYSQKVYESCKTMKHVVMTNRVSSCSSEDYACRKHEWFNSLEYKVASMTDYRIKIIFKFNISGPISLNNDHYIPLERKAHSCGEKINTELESCPFKPCNETCHRIKSEEKIQNHIDSQTKSSILTFHHDKSAVKVDTFSLLKCDEEKLNISYESKFFSEEQYFSYLTEFIISACAFSIICLVLITLFVSHVQRTISYNRMDQNSDYNRSNASSNSSTNHDEDFGMKSFGKSLLKK